jgi:5S rRNA maturation endonuclease (ribonuclease M5)
MTDHSGTAYERLIDALRGHGPVTETNGDARAKCPAHNGTSSTSLAIHPIDGAVLICCHAGCDTADVLAAIGLGMADLYDNHNGAEYIYPDGRRVHRSANKRFYQSGNRKGQALFHADRIGDADTIYVVEGEKDVLAVESVGGVAVCSAMGAGKADKFDWSPLKGKTAIIVADKDDPGRKHAAQVAELLDGIAETITIKQAVVGKDPADHIAAEHTLDQLTDTDWWTPPPPPITLTQAHKVFKGWLGDNYDTDALDVMLCTVAVEKFNDGSDPIWLLLISGPGNAKTETVLSADGIGATITSAISSEGALLSASSKRDRTKDATGGLLPKIGDRGVLVIKDVTSILSMDRNIRGRVLAALREVYDGRWIREVGTDGGKTLTWTGRIAVVGAVTTAWDTSHGAVSTMGDRFVLVRMDSAKSRHAAGRKAIGNTGDEKRMRAELAEAVAGVIAAMSREPITVTDDETEALIDAADLVTLARTGVEYDYKGNVIDAHAPEMPTRFAKQLTQIMRGAVAIGMDRTDALRLAIRCARDSMPPLRLAIIDHLAANPGDSTSRVRKGIDKPYVTVDRQLQALHMLGVLGVDEVEYQQNKSRWYYTLADGINPDAIKPEAIQDHSSPEMLVGTRRRYRREEETETKSSDPGVGTHISGEESTLFDQPSPNGQAPRCQCGNALTSPEAINSGKCKPCRDELMSGYDR